METDAAAAASPALAQDQDPKRDEATPDKRGDHRISDEKTRGHAGLGPCRRLGVGAVRVDHSAVAVGKAEMGLARLVALGGVGAMALDLFSLQEIVDVHDTHSVQCKRERADVTEVSQPPACSRCPEPAIECI